MEYETRRRKKVKVVLTSNPPQVGYIFIKSNPNISTKKLKLLRKKREELKEKGKIKIKPPKRNIKDLKGVKAILI